MATGTTPSGRVCVDHAIEFYRGLVATAKAQLAERRAWEASPEYQEMQAIARDCVPTPPVVHNSRYRKVQRDALVAALEQCGWVQTEAAKALGISRRQMHYQIRRHGIQPPPWKHWSGSRLLTHVAR